MSFSGSNDLLLRQTATEWVAICTVAGGTPAHPQRLDDTQALSESLPEHFMRRSGLFHTEPLFSIETVIHLTDLYPRCCLRFITPEVVLGQEWQVYPYYFASAGFSGLAREEARNVMLMDLETLDKD